MIPEQPGRPAHPRHVTDQDGEDEEALEVELNAEARLDAADARAASVYEAGVWRELRGAHDVGVPLRRLRKRRRAGGAEAEAGNAQEPRWRQGEEGGGDRGLRLGFGLFRLILQYSQCGAFCYSALGGCRRSLS